MEPSNAGRKIFRARKTMTPSSRLQIESLNKLKEILGKERTSRAKESQNTKLNTSDEIISKSDHFTQEGSKFESNKAPLSEEKDISPSKLKVSIEILGEHSSVNVCSPGKEVCHSKPHSDELKESQKEKHFDIEKSPISQQPVENPLIRNIFQEMYEKNNHAVLPEDITVAMSSKLQENLPRRLQDMLVQEKKLIATTASSNLETKRDSEGVKITDKVRPVLEKIIIPLNTSEVDEDDGLLAILERINATVDSNVAKQTGAIDIQREPNHVPTRESFSNSSSAHLLNKVQVVSDMKSNTCSRVESLNITCLGGNATSPQKDTIVDNLKSETCSGSNGKNVSSLDEKSASEKDTVSDMESEDCDESESKNLSCFDGKATSPLDTVVGDLKSKAFGGSDLSSGKEAIPSEDTVSNIESEDCSESESKNLSCFDGKAIYHLDTVVGDFRRQSSGGSDSKNVSCLGEKATSDKETVSDMESEHCGEYESKNLSSFVGKAISHLDTVVDDLKSKACGGSDSQNVSCLDEKLTSSEKNTVGGMESEDCSESSESENLSFLGEKATSDKEKVSNMENEDCGESESKNISCFGGKSTSHLDTVVDHLKSKTYGILDSKHLSCLGEIATSEEDTVGGMESEPESKNLSCFGGKTASPLDTRVVDDLKSKDCDGSYSKNVSCLGEKVTSTEEQTVSGMSNESESKTFSCFGGKATPLDTLVVDLKSKDCDGSDSKNMFCLGEKATSTEEQTVSGMANESESKKHSCFGGKTTSLDTVYGDMKSKDCGGSESKNKFYLGEKATSTVEKTVSSMASESESKKLSCSGGKVTSLDMEFGDLKSENCGGSVSKSLSCLGEKTTYSEKDTVSDMESEDCGESERKNLSCFGGKATSTVEKTVSSLASESESKKRSCSGGKTTSLDMEFGDLKSENRGGSDSKSFSCLGEKTTSEEDTVSDMESEDCGESERKNLSCFGGKATSTVEKTVSSMASESESKKRSCSGGKTTSLDTEFGDLKSENCGGSDSKSFSCLGEKTTYSEKDTVSDMESEDCGESERKNLSCFGGKATSPDTVAGDLNSETVCPPFKDVSCLGPTLTPQSVTCIDLSNGSVRRKRLNSESYEITICKRFKPADNISSLSGKTKDISEKVTCLIERQLQVLFTDVFDQRLEQLTERVKQIQCRKQHEEVIAKYIRKLRRFEGHANIVLKSLKEFLRLNNKQSSTTDFKDTVPVKNLDFNQKILTEKLVAIDPVLASTAVKSSFAPCLQSTSPTKSPMTVSASTIAKPSGLANLQSVSPTVSQTNVPFLQSECGKEAVLFDSDSESKRLPRQNQMKSLTTSNNSGVENKLGSTNAVNVINSNSENKVENEDLNKKSGPVIDLTEDEECSSNKAISLKDEDSVMTNEKTNLKENEAMRIKSVSSLKAVNDGEISALPKKICLSKSPQKLHLEHVSSSEKNEVPLNTGSNHYWTSKKSIQDIFKVSENAAKPKNTKSFNGDERQQSKLESMKVDHTSTVPSNSKNAEKTSQKLNPDTTTGGDNCSKPISTLSNEVQKAPQVPTSGSLIVKDAIAIPSSLKSQEKEATAQKSSLAFQEHLQSSPLQNPELRVGVKDSLHLQKPELKQTLPPQKPELKLTQVQNPRGIALSWNCAKIDPKCSPAQSYCLYVQQENSSCSKAEWKWKKIGEIKALPLPMACTLSQFVGGSRYYFTVRAKDIFERYGPFADVQSTTLLPFEKTHDSTLEKTRDST